MTANKGSTTKRNVPDVALTANNVYVEEGGGAYSVGGTSCAAPLWAAFTALVNQQAVAAGKSTVGFVNQAIYTIGAGSSYTTDFHDITTGNNYSSSSPSKFPAVSGYDLCTGWGTPAGTPLINALAPIPASLDVSPTVTFASTGPVGGPFTPSTNSYTLTNPGTSTLAWTASANQTWLSLSATSGTLAANGSATVTASINAGADTLASGTYSGVVLFTYVTTGTVQTAPVTLTVVPAPVITSATSATATAGQPFTYQIAATNSPVSYAASGLPSNLSVDSATGVISGTASLSATGTSNVTISAINLGGTGSATLSLLVQTPYAAWQSTMFTAAELADPAISGDTADPAGDGISNLMKYALNIEPWTSGVAGLPAGSIVTTSSGSYLTITYTQVISAIDLTYTVQVSPDLNTWYSGTGYTNPPFATANADGVTETVTVQSAVPMTSGTSGQFIRLQVTGP
jgi:hypothetical protein